MKDEFLIDRHKLNYHPEEVSCWLKKEPFYPIYVEISPTNRCNHRCIFCGFGYTEHKNQDLDTEYLSIAIQSMAECGIKAIMFCGEGEPLLHPDIADLIKLAKELGIDVSLTTNGVLMNEEFLKNALPYLNWIKVSVDGGTPETYSKVHGCKKSDFNTLMKNLETAVEIRDKNNYSCTIGTQSILLDENTLEIYDLARTLKKTGVDYFVIKPYTPHPYNKDNLDINELQDVWNWFGDQRVLDLKDDKFDVIVRYTAFENQDLEREYHDCYASDFWCYIGSDGAIYICNNYLGNPDYIYGNIYQKTFKEIWDTRPHIDIDLNNCRKICRMNEVNNYLWRMKNPPAHKNFI